MTAIVWGPLNEPSSFRPRQVLKKCVWNAIDEKSNDLQGTGKPEFH